MKRKGLLKVVMTAVLSAILLVGCGNDSAAKQEEEMQKAIDAAVEEALKEKDEKDENSKEADLTESDAADDEEAIDYGYTEDEGDFSYSQIADMSFCYSEDGENWNTEISIAEDGTFRGTYWKMDPNETGAKYPEGTYYYSSFSGKMSQPIKMNDYTYSADADALEYDDDIGATEITDGIQYIFVMPGGISDHNSFHFYMPGAMLDDLQESFLEGAKLQGMAGTNDVELPFYGLYDVDEECGFKGLEMAEEATDTPGIDERIASDEFMEQELYGKIEEGGLSQVEINQTMAEIYQIWDDELNWIWDEMEARVDMKTMNNLRIEQREWVEQRTQAMEKAGTEAKDELTVPYLECDEGIKRTKERVNELAEWIR